MPVSFQDNRDDDGRAAAAQLAAAVAVPFESAHAMPSSVYRSEGFLHKEFQHSRRMTWLLAIYPSLLITLTPGYFWYLSLHPDGVDKVRILFGGGMSPDYVDDPEAQSHFAKLKTLPDEVNVEDRGCTEKVYKGLCSDYAVPGPLSHLERPNYDFAHSGPSSCPVEYPGDAARDATSDAAAEFRTLMRSEGACTPADIT